MSVIFLFPFLFILFFLVYLPTSSLNGRGLNTFWKSDFRIFSEKKNWSTRDGRGTIVAPEQLTTCLKLRTNRSVKLIGINLNYMESSACSTSGTFAVSFCANFPLWTQQPMKKGNLNRWKKKKNWIGQRLSVSYSPFLSTISFPVSTGDKIWGARACRPGQWKWWI